MTTRALALLLLTAALAPEARAQDAPPKRPNVLFLAVDDLGTAVGFLGEEAGNPLRWLYPDPAVRARVRAVLTPNIDRLAARGVPFAQAHAAGARCAPSRAALMTGVRPHVSGYARNGQGHFRDIPALDAAQTLPEYLRANGYHTAGAGKVYHRWAAELGADGRVAQDTPDAERSWDTWLNARVGTGGPEAWSPWSASATLRMGISRQSLPETNDVGNAVFVADLLRTGSGVQYDDTYDIVREVTLPADRPFFLALGLYRPHDPLLVPREVLDRLRPDDIAVSEALRAEFEADLADVPPEAQAFVGHDGTAVVSGETHAFFQHARGIDAENGTRDAWREAVWHYLAGVIMADHAVGLVLDALEASPHAANTAVVLWGDHGWHLGEKAWFGKHTLWSAATHTTLVVAPPEASGVAAPGALRGAPVSLMDIYPTVLGLLGLPVPAHVDGADLAPALADPAADPGSEVLTTEWRTNHALRQGRYRYIRYRDDPTRAELYDMVADPYERVNLSRDPAYASTAAALDAELDAFLAPPVAAAAPPAPEAFSVRLAPNPARGLARVTYRLPAPAEVRVSVHDALGRRVALVEAGRRAAGEHTAALPAGPLAPGVYVVRVAAGEAVQAQRWVVIR